MRKIKSFIFLFLVFGLQIVFSQIVEIKGRVSTTLEAENIHVINKTAQKFTTTNAFGAFKIPAKLNDTLQFSSIQHKLKEVVVDAQILMEKHVEVHLEEFTYALDEVVVGRMLTGNIFDDMNQVQGEPMTALKLGIPSYLGKPKTQSERRLNEATTGVFLFPIINAISGRTKELKERVKLERKEDLLADVRKRTEALLFSIDKLKEAARNEFFYFCSDDVNFVIRCKGKNDLEILEFLRVKLLEYKSRLNIETD